MLNKLSVLSARSWLMPNLSYGVWNWNGQSEGGVSFTNDDSMHLESLLVKSQNASHGSTTFWEVSGP